MARTINFAVDDDLHKKIVKLKKEKRWSWREFIIEAYKKLSEEDEVEKNNTD